MVADRRQRFRRRDRVCRSGEFTSILRRGACAADDQLVVNVQPRQPNDQEPAAGGLPSRLGITIPKKTGSAVVRNRWKRWIRQAFRTRRERLPEGLDIIVRPKRGAVGSYQKVAKSLPATVRRAARRIVSAGAAGPHAATADSPPWPDASPSS